MKETILILCAHPDDEVFGIGGTISKYVGDGKKVISVIFTYGEMAMPWMKPEEVQKIRQKESLLAAKIIGTHETLFLGLKEGQMDKVGSESRQFLIDLIHKEQPEKIFTHSNDDPHLDHRGVYRLVCDVVKKAQYKGDLYAFDVWNPITLKKRFVPKLYVDISQTFSQKIEASKVFETQKMQGRWPLVPALTMRAVVYGWLNGCKYAERFRKIDV